MPSFSILKKLMIFTNQKIPATFEGVKLPMSEEDVPVYASLGSANIPCDLPRAIKRVTSLEPPVKTHA
jgi:hypothetical protein